MNQFHDALDVQIIHKNDYLVVPSFDDIEDWTSFEVVDVSFIRFSAILLITEAYGSFKSQIGACVGLGDCNVEASLFNPSSESMKLDCVGSLETYLEDWVLEMKSI